jgi:hypothetical protein
VRIPGGHDQDDAGCKDRRDSHAVQPRGSHHMSELPRLGFIGVGTIAEALITGMCAAGEQRATFLLSVPMDRVSADPSAARPQAAAPRE